MKIKVEFTVDMLLDCRLTLCLIGEEVKYKPLTRWCTPNLKSRDNDDWHKYEPIATDTHVKFEFEIRDDLPRPLYIDLEQSMVEMGYTGSQKDWVGPGRLFNYSLSRFLRSDENKINLIEIKCNPE